MTEIERIRREKISKALKGRKKPPFSTEHRRKLSETNKGKKLSESTKAKMFMFGKGNQYAKGVKHTEEWKVEARKRKPNLGIKLSEETKKKIGETRRNNPKIRKEFHYNWKGGITPINAHIRASNEYKLWRKAVFERDNYQCIWGGKEHGKKLHADHIKPFAYFPELRFAIDNGRTLCVDCHKTTDTYGVKVKKIYGKQ